MVGLRPGLTFVYLERTDMEPQIGCQESLVLGQCQTDLELSNGGVVGTQVPLSQNLCFLPPASCQHRKELCSVLHPQAGTQRHKMDADGIYYYVGVCLNFKHLGRV